MPLTKRQTQELKRISAGDRDYQTFVYESANKVYPLLKGLKEKTLRRVFDELEWLRVNLVWGRKLPKPLEEFHTVTRKIHDALLEQKTHSHHSFTSAEDELHKLVEEKRGIKIAIKRL